jgi:two-component system, OmpR family, sensor histidine kinase QseC
MKLLRRSLLRRMMVVQLLVVVAFSLLTIFNLLWGFKKNGEGELDQNLQMAAKAVAASIGIDNNQPEVVLQNAKMADALFREIARFDEAHTAADNQHYGFALRVAGAAGQTLYQTPQYSQLLLDTQKNTFYEFEQDNQTWRAYNYKATEQNLQIQVAKTTNQVNSELIAIIKKYFVWPLLLYLPVAAIVTWLTSAGVLRPLRELADMISLRSPNDMRPLHRALEYAETQPIVQEINTLLQKLEITLQRERNFLADAAHELRTPLAVIQAQVHVLRHAASELEKTNASSELNVGIGRAASLIQKLLVTAKVSVDNYTPRLEVVDLSAFVQERMAALSMLAAHKHLDMELDAPHGCNVQMDRETFVSAVDNVLDNAIRYTPEGGQIRVCVELVGGGRVLLRVADNGVGIPQGLYERVFERFFRIAGTEQQGSGLGLAIVKRVLALHDGEVALAPGLNQRGLSVNLTMPLRAQAS